VDVDRKDDVGRIPLSLASEDDRRAVVSILLANWKGNVNSKDSEGCNALW
jgi:hypothetical protein